MAAGFTDTIDDSTSAFWKTKAGDGIRSSCERAFQEESSEGNSSLFIELFLARLTAERNAGNYGMCGYGVKASPQTRSAL
jgi:hypothetical protein